MRRRLAFYDVELAPMLWGPAQDRMITLPAGALTINDLVATLSEARRALGQQLKAAALACRAAAAECRAAGEIEVCYYLAGLAGEYYEAMADTIECPLGDMRRRWGERLRLARQAAANGVDGEGRLDDGRPMGEAACSELIYHASEGAAVACEAIVALLERGEAIPYQQQLLPSQPATMQVA